MAGPSIMVPLTLLESFHMAIDPARNIPGSLMAPAIKSAKFPPKYPKIPKALPLEPVFLHNRWSHHHGSTDKMESLHRPIDPAKKIPASELGIRRQLQKLSVYHPKKKDFEDFLTRSYNKTLFRNIAIRGREVDFKVSRERLDPAP
jgi:hypothetical protein